MKKIINFTAIICLIVLFSCSHDSGDYTLEESAIPSNHNYSRHETRFVRTAMDFVASLNGKTRQVKTREVGNIYAWLSKDLYPSTRTSETPEGLPDTLLYIVNFDNDQGFVLIRPQDMNGEIVAFVEEGNLTPSDSIVCPGFELFLEDLAYFPYDTVLADTTQIAPPPGSQDPRVGTDDPIPTDQWTIESQVTPLLLTKWGESSPFNVFCPTNTGERTMAGCIPIGTAQIVAYHKYPANYYNHTYHWELISDMPTPTTPNGIHDAARLVSDIGNLENTVYGLTQSITAMEYVPLCLDEFGYHYSYDLYDFDRCFSNLQDGYPVLMAGRDYPNYRLQSWVVDGAIIRALYADYIGLDGTPGTTLLSRQELVHCNWGWFGAFNGYFLSGVFALQSKVKDDNYYPPTFPTNDDYDFSSSTSAYYDIYPNN